MSAFTLIQWCLHTWNPWRGCRKVSEECELCYIVDTVPFRTTGQVHGPVRVRAGEDTLKAPYRWNKAAEKAGERHRVFCLSLGDWLDDENVPIEWLAGLLKTVCETPWLDWLLLTKRPQNFNDRLEAVIDHLSSAEMLVACSEDDDLDGEVIALHDFISDWLHTPRRYPANVWIGVSQGADQEAALKIPARIHFLSCEPMLRPLDTTHAAKFDWIIFGGESGNMKHPNPARRPRQCDMDWIRAGLSFCLEHGIKAYVKQMGTNCRWPGVAQSFKFKHKKGGHPDEWPEDLRVREFPSVA